MFEWFRKKKDDSLKDLVKVLKDGITINVNIINSDNIDAKKRGDSLEERPKGERGTSQAESKQDSQGTGTKKVVNPIPNFKKLKGPEVSFGEEKEV